MEEDLDSMHLVDLDDASGYVPSLTYDHSSGDGEEGVLCRQDSIGARAVAPNLRRKAHRKSRGGCFNCKSRKIKCQETKPACENCLCKDLDCRYPSKAEQKIKRRREEAPTVAVIAAAAHNGQLSPNTLVQMQATPTLFSITDMRLFHHFITVAYPHLPLGNDSVWLNDIPLFAHQQEYLMHAILSLGASHLSRLCDGGADYVNLAIYHRGLAIQGLNQAISRKPKIFGDYDAMLACCYALTFQSSYMADGLTDFITMVRGCALVTSQIRNQEEATAFNISDDWDIRLQELRQKSLPIIDPYIIEGATQGLEAVLPFVQDPLDRIFYEALFNTVESLGNSSIDGYLNFIKVYAVWYDIPHSQFSWFVDPTNVVAQLLLAHFIAIQLIMIPLTERDWPRRVDRHARGILGPVDWAEKIYDRCPDAFKGYMDWAMGIVRTVRIEVEQGQTESWTILKGRTHF